MGLANAHSYYSHKLGTAAYQFQCVVLHSGQCVHVTDVEPAATHDITVYKKNRPLLLAGLRAGGIDNPVILADQGYKAPDIPELFVPSQPISIVNSKRLIVENYSGGVAAVLAPTRHRYRMSLEHINLYVRALCFLTNYHVFNPLGTDEYLSRRKLGTASPERPRGGRRNKETGWLRGGRQKSRPERFLRCSEARASPRHPSSWATSSTRRPRGPTGSSWAGQEPRLPGVLCPGNGRLGVLGCAGVCTHIYFTRAQRMPGVSLLSTSNKPPSLPGMCQDGWGEKGSADPDLERGATEGWGCPRNWQVPTRARCLCFQRPCALGCPDLDWRWVAGPGTPECSTSSRGLSPAPGAR